MNLEKLKDTARKHEQKEDWRKAIDVYQKAIQHFEAGRESELDLALYNRVGDLYLKLNDPSSAVQSYERAADLYGEQGFLNNAIALCGKILRVNPGRVQTYLKLAHLHARKNVVSEAKRNLIEYLERMNTLGKLDEAFQQLKTFADQHSGNHEIRMMLVELLRAASRTDEAREQLEKMAADLEARGDRAGARKTREQMQAIEAAPPQAPPPPAAQGKNDLIFIETGFQAPTRQAPPAAAPPPVTAPPPPPPEPIAGLEATTREPDESAVDVPPMEGLVLDGAAALDADVEPDPGLALEHATDFDDLLAEPVDAAPLDLDPAFETDAPDLDMSVPDTFSILPAASFDADDLDLDAPLDAPADVSLEGALDSPLDAPPESPFDAPLGTSTRYIDDFDVGPPIELESRLGSDVEFIQPEEVDLPFSGMGDDPEAAASAGGTTIEELEDRILDDPDAAAPHRELADLVAESDPARAVEEYTIALAAYEGVAEWVAALDSVDALLRLEPDAIKYQQKRVELAYRSGDRRRLVEAYAELADSLVRAGAADKAVAVYGRVLEHDPANARAREATARLTAEAEAEPEPAPEAAPPPAITPPAVASKPAAAPPAAPPAARPATPGGFIDFGSMVIEDEGPRDTRMKVDTERPTGDEQKDFLETLEQFKKGIEANIGSDDYEAHYDLGVAFKEMGLLDEAVAEFQKALRSPNGRLRTSEALGVTFFEKQQFAIAETILRRAVEGPEAGRDDEKIGLLYWLGRACEELGKTAEARRHYERALAVDIRFMDLGERVQRLSAGREA